MTTRERARTRHRRVASRRAAGRTAPSRLAPAPVAVETLVAARYGFAPGAVVPVVLVCHDGAHAVGLVADGAGLVTLTREVPVGTVVIWPDGHAQGVHDDESPSRAS